MSNRLRRCQRASHEHRCILNVEIDRTPARCGCPRGARCGVGGGPVMRGVIEIVAVYGVGCSVAFHRGRYERGKSSL